jgi:hypothetical protein
MGRIETSHLHYAVAHATIVQNKFIAADAKSEREASCVRTCGFIMSQAAQLGSWAELELWPG